MPECRLIVLENVPIYEQLQLEEALLRTSDEQICLVNRGSTPAIVVGISGKPEELIHLERVGTMPVIRRFSGGGTVVVDQNTLFVTFIMNGKAFPEEVHHDMADFYQEVLGPSVSLRENDYVLGERKFGGNAQYIRRERWLHHTSFLYRYDPQLMSYLKHPKKKPDYRKDRIHEDFVCDMSALVSSKTQFIDQVIEELGSRFVVKKEGEVWKDFASHRQSTKLIDTPAILHKKNC